MSPDWISRAAPRYNRLTLKELHALPLHGCGGKGGWFDVPDLVFKATCLKHDYAYWVGGCRNDRRKADRAFLLDMMGDAEKLQLSQFVPFALAAGLYYLAVRVYGGKFFHGPIKRDRGDIQKAVSDWEQQNRALYSS